MSAVDEIVSPSVLRDWPLPDPGAGKDSRGRVLVVGGARFAPGAAMLAGLAALRVGAGVLTLAVSEVVAGAVGVSVPEAGVIALPEQNAAIDDRSRQELYSSVLEVTSRNADAILVGPGLDNIETAGELVTAVVASVGAEVPVVLDAYALGAWASLAARTRSALADRLVMTPNHSEVRRLLSQAEDGSSEKPQDLHRVSELCAAVVSSSNIVVGPTGRGWKIAAGHPGLGTSGSGDVLAGAIVGLLARGADLDQAACWATYLHAAAGDRLAARVGPLGFLARELADELAFVLTELQA